MNELEAVLGVVTISVDEGNVGIMGLAYLF